MFLHIRITWFLMMLTNFSVTCFGIDLLWVWASTLAPFWHLFGIKIMFPVNRFLMICWIVFYCFLLKKGNTFITCFHHLFDPVPKRFFLDVPWLTMVPFSICFCCFGHVSGSILEALRNVFPYSSHCWFVDDLSIAFLVGFW